MEIMGRPIGSMDEEEITYRMPTRCSDLGLDWGLKLAVPEGVTTAWGARGLNEDRIGILADRQSLVGEHQMELEVKLRLVLGRVQQAFKLLKDAGFITDREFRVVKLFEDDNICVVGSTCKSHGYFYVSAWLKVAACQVK